MTQLAILTATERRRFDRPPKLSTDERRLYFDVTPDVRPAIARISQSTYRAGFLLQLGYFRANARFFSPEQFHRQDIEYVQRALSLGPVDLTQYGGTVMRRHRQRICRLLNWHSIDDAAHEALVLHANHYVANQEYPKRVFSALVDLCWKRQWLIPTYHELADIITNSFNASEQAILGSVGRELTPTHTVMLDALLVPLRKDKRSAQPAALTALKFIDQSIKPARIKASLEILLRFREHFMSLRDIISALPMSDKATEYYAAWLIKVDHQQLTQFSNRQKTYLHLLAFIKHQFYARQDAAIDVLLKSVTTTRNAVKAQLSKRDHALKAERDLAIQALRKAHLSASEFANNVVAITRAADATPSEKGAVQMMGSCRPE